VLSKNAPKKLFLLDAYALIYRAYFAFAKNPRVNSKGQNTSAAFGFTNVLMDVLATEKPTHLAVVLTLRAEVSIVKLRLRLTRHIARRCQKIFVP